MATTKKTTRTNSKRPQRVVRFLATEPAGTDAAHASNDLLNDRPTTEITLTSAHFMALTSDSDLAVRNLPKHIATLESSLSKEAVNTALATGESITIRVLMDPA